MTNTAIASTQKAGEGDATILGNNSRPIAENLLAQASQQAKAKAAGDLLKQKGIQENQTKFFQNLGGLKEKVWMQDIPEITGDVNALIDKAVQMQKSGINPFDPNNGSAYTELWGDIEKLQAKQEASKSAELRFNNALSTLDKDKGNDLDIMKTKVILDAGAGKKIMERTTEDFNVAYAPVDFSKKLKEVDKIVLPQLKMAKSYYDQNQVDVANKAIEDMKLMIPDFVTGLYSREIAQGRTTPEEALQRATEYVNTLTQDASLDPTKINALALAKTKEANLEAFRKAKLELEKGRLAVSQRNATTAEKKQASSETVPLDVVALLEQAKNGDVNAIKLLNAGNKYGGDVNSITKVVKGDGRKLINPATGNTFIASPNMTFFELTDNNGKITYQATDEEALKGMANGSWGQGVNKATQIDITTEKNVKPIGLGTPKQSQVGSKSSTSSSTKNKTSSGNKVVTSGKVIIKKGYNPKTDQTQFIYSDGTKEIVNGKQ